MEQLPDVEVAARPRSARGPSSTAGRRGRSATGSDVSIDASLRMGVVCAAPPSSGCASSCAPASDRARCGSEARLPSPRREAPRSRARRPPPSAAAAAGRTSSTVTARPSSRAIVVNCASSSPQAVIHSVNGAGSRSTLSAYPCVVTQRETWTPIEAIFRGPRPPPAGIHTPVSPSCGVAVEAERRQSFGRSPRSRSRTYFLRSLPVPVEVEDRVADELSRRVVGRFPAAIGLDHLDVDAVGKVELGRLVRPAPDVTTGGCSSRITVSGIPALRRPPRARAAARAPRRRGRAASSSRRCACITCRA